MEIFSFDQSQYTLAKVVFLCAFPFQILLRGLFNNPRAPWLLIHRVCQNSEGGMGKDSTCPVSRYPCCLVDPSRLCLGKNLTLSDGGDILTTLKIPLWFIRGLVCLDDGKNCVLRW